MLKDIFISYNGADDTWARSLAARIEQESITGTPNGEKLSAFFAPWDIEYGPNFIKKLNEGLRGARFFAPVLSPEFFESGWANFEWTDQVALDPTNAQGRIIPLFLRDVSLDGSRRIELAAPFTTLNRIDFRDSSDFEAQFAELLRVLRGVPKQRGFGGAPIIVQSEMASASSVAHSYAFPSATEELLVSNLLKMENIPSLVWSGKTSARKSKDVWEKVETADAFVLREGRLYTFANITDTLCPLRKAIECATIGDPDETSDWLGNADKKRNLMALLNECVRQHCRERKIGKDEKGRFYFWPVREYMNGEHDAPPTLTTRFYKLPQETKLRAVAARKTTPTNEVFWVHYASRIRAENCGHSYYLRIEPTYVFTKDGREPLDGKSVGRLSIQWSGKQQNPDVLRAVLFWAHVLSDGHPQIRIPAGATSITASIIPAVARATFGIAGDYIRVNALIEEYDVTLDDIAADVELVEHVTEDAEPNDSE